MVTQALVRELFDYEDGLLIKRTRRRGNRLGDMSGVIMSNGYLQSCINGQSHLTHRLVFLWHHGWLPDQVDHVNGITNDNRVENLRAGDAHYNALNRKGRSKRGLPKNVDIKRGRYGVRIMIDGRNRRFGQYDTLEEATAVATRVRAEHFGEWARHDSVPVS